MLVVSGSWANYTGLFPNIQAVNVSAPGSGDGTEYIAPLINDGIWGPWQALMSRASLTPNGVVESATASQLMTAFEKAFAVGPGIGVTYWKNGTPAANGDRVLLLQGQLILIASYTELVTDCYVGDTNNPTAPAFYKCDVGGTRDTAGLYFKLPDARAVSLKGAGNQTINTRVKSGPAFGAVEEDQLENHWHQVERATTSQKFGASAGAGTDYGLTTTGQTVDAAIGKTIITDGINSVRQGATTRDCTLGTNFGITY
jgi:hypothetical protein